MDKLIQKKEKLSQLEKAIQKIYLASSAKALAVLIEQDLPKQCEVDRITLDFAPLSAPQKTSKAYHYTVHYNENSYLIRFHKHRGLYKVNKSFLKQIGRALEIRLNQMEQYYSAQNQKEQWELAFDTIDAAICLTNMQNQILRTNKTFRYKTKLSKKELLQKNYFTVFFGSSMSLSPPKPDGNKKRFYRTIKKDPSKQECFEVLVQTIGESYPVQLVILRDITEQMQIEKKIAQLAKLRELGIISSSIAHELNNPIGGMHSTLQLLQMKKLGSSLKEDIHEMSLATQRCLRIIHELLNAHR